jgi:hypothetical protein
MSNQELYAGLRAEIAHMVEEYDNSRAHLETLHERMRDVHCRINSLQERICFFVQMYNRQATANGVATIPLPIPYGGNN